MPITADTSPADVIHELLLLSLPLSIGYTPQTQPLLSSLPINAQALAFYDSSQSSSQSDEYFLDSILTIASHYKGRIILIEVPSDEFHLLQFFNFQISDLPQLILIDSEDKDNLKKYLFSEFLHRLKDNHNQHSASNQDRQYMMKVISSENPAEEDVFIYYNTTHFERFFDLFLYERDRIKQSLLSQSIDEIEVINKQLQHIPVENIAGVQFDDK